MGRPSFCDVISIYLGIATALRISEIHWINGFETGCSSDPSTFVSSKTFLEFLRELVLRNL